MNDLEELIIAIGKVVLGLVVLIGGLVALDLAVYLSVTSSTFDENVASAYDGSYEQGYGQTYEDGYQDGYGEAYHKGYSKGYEIGRGSSSKEAAAYRVELHNPTYKEVIDFLAGDKTDSNPFIKGEYVCFDFAAELNNNAEASGIRAAYVRIRAREWGHAIVAFETVDRGLVFIEPQSDKDVPLVIGEPYPWQQVGANRPMHYDDAVVEIQMIW